MDPMAPPALLNSHCGSAMMYLPQRGAARRWCQRRSFAQLCPRAAAQRAGPLARRGQRRPVHWREKCAREAAQRK